MFEIKCTVKHWAQTVAQDRENDNNTIASKLNAKLETINNIAA